VSSLSSLAVFALVVGISLLTTTVLALIITASRAQVVVECADDRTREQVRMLVMAGLDQALIGQQTKLFEVWMRDVHQSPPRNAQRGLDLAVNAYIKARASVLKWSPPLCG
jgi:hypothetical protein